MKFSISIPSLPGLKPVKTTAAIFVSFALFMQCSFTYAGEGAEKLKAFHKSVKTFEAAFSQKVVDNNNKELQASFGKVYLSRPGKFRWDYEKPDKQVIVSDGTKIWLYDQDLEQVTIKSLEGVVGNSPARVLSDTGDLEKEYKIIEKGKKDGILWVELLPKKGESSFQFVRLGFADTLKLMAVKDSLGQVTTIEFSELKTNPELKESLFEFKPPKGVDVVTDPSLRKKAKIIIKEKTSNE